MKLINTTKKDIEIKLPKHYKGLFFNNHVRIFKTGEAMVLEDVLKDIPAVAKLLKAKDLVLEKDYIKEVKPVKKEEKKKVKKAKKA